MALKTALFSRTYEFRDVKELLCRAGEEKSGDLFSGLAAKSRNERAAAKVVLADLSLDVLYNNPSVAYEKDEVTRAIVDGLDQKRMRNQIPYGGAAGVYFISRKRNQENPGGITPKWPRGCEIMGNLDLILASSKFENIARCNTAVGRRGVLASRLQPNHPTDAVGGIMASLMEGISYGVGDAVIGLNPVTDNAQMVRSVLGRFQEFIGKWKIPTQCCVLAHITSQMRALQNGAVVDVLFQSIAGSQKSNEAFGINVALLDEAYAMMKEKKHAAGPNFMYFETGEGSELSSEGNFGTDQLTMEARCYGLARRYAPFLVNSVVGFIGPEYLYDGKQVTRAGLEDHFMGKLFGLPMGVDVCCTNHVLADFNDLEGLLMLLTSAGCSYFMGIPGGDDVMLMYNTTSYHDIAALREVSGKRPVAEFEKRMEELGILQNGTLSANAGNAAMFLGEVF
jgi:ethanolamine ammonia-lyase large subunit